ncbi:TrbI/VirB10 family protein [Ferrovum sp. PN-J185]|uniref:TrbI/VirB10 family protein n=1 Tax=Ferrovum sp. PN-J185 TaxID=1356306 RepID=UPI0007928399|nr:TrbI/VirB10 family protein [Ferrovum sp. PN-J185]KXW56457.1 type IV secretion system protein PtlG [Ferrovum sp. PN-J185]MCC6068194.1 TrbI/VirB10 family protein [Ferrovum sp. PN-J185]MDE1891693.1 TrbI/VirB10 family protein [Betaproteobacteria bacterium]MDE2056465.1 TrbI/VirB10 family protein [Betaproteobacteria bacterium]
MWSWLIKIIKHNDDELEKVIPVAEDTGKRLLPRTKWILLGIVGLLIILLTIGILTAGQQHTSQENAFDYNNPSSIGTATPPSPPPLIIHHDINNTANLHDKENINSSSALTNSNPSASNLNQHQIWLRDHYYQRQESTITNYERALNAPLLGEGVSHPNSSSNLSTTNIPQSSVHLIKQDISNKEDEFADQLSKKRDGSTSSSQLISAKGEHEILAGSILNAILITEINSDLPGVITAQISQNVFDSLHPDLILIPQGTRLIGRYDNRISYGQQRLFIAWNSLIFPDGSSFDLKGLTASDNKGQAGLNDQIDNHTGRIVGSALLISMLGVGAQLSQPQNSSILTSPNTGQLAAGASANELNMVGSQLLQKNLNISPTLIIRAGTELTVMANQTLILPVYNHD